MTDDGRIRDYAPLAIIFHWSIAVLIIANLVIGWIGEELERGPEKFALLQWHMSLGLLVLLLSALRLAWRWIQPPPPPLTSTRWEASLVKAVHAGLLAITLLGPATGIAARLAEGRSVTFFGIELAAAPHSALFAWARADEDRDHGDGPRETAKSEGREQDADERIWQGIHALLVKPVLILLLILHVGGALKHHFLDRDPTLLRMLGRTPRPTGLKGPTLP